MRRLIFKSEQRFCFACKEQSLRKIATVAGSIGSSGFRWEIMTPTEIPEWNPPPMRRGHLRQHYNESLRR